MSTKSYSTRGTYTANGRIDTGESIQYTTKANHSRLVLFVGLLLVAGIVLFIATHL